MTKPEWRIPNGRTRALNYKLQRFLINNAVFRLWPSVTYWVTVRAGIPRTARNDKEDFSTELRILE